MAQKWVKIRFGASFPSFRPVFFFFPGEAETYIFLFFFPISGRRPEMGSVPGKQDRNCWGFRTRRVRMACVRGPDDRKNLACFDPIWHPRDQTQRNSRIRESLLSVIFLPAIPGPEMLASIWWAPGIFCRKPPCP